MMQMMAIMACGLYLGSALLLASLELRMGWRSLFWRTISSHALGRERGRFDLYGVLMMAGVLCHAVAIQLHGGLGWAVPVWLCVLAIMLGGLLLFPTDSHGVEPGQHPVRARQREGYIHVYFAMGSFASGAVIVLLGQPRMGLVVSGALLEVLDWLAITVAAMLSALIITGFWKPAQGLFGLAERGFFYAAAAWFILNALALAVGPVVPPMLAWLG